MAKKNQNSEQRRMVEGAKNYDYTGIDDDVLPSPSLNHVRVDWGKPGRRLTKEVIHQMSLLVAAGLPIPSACTALGLGRAFNQWGDKARRDDKADIEPGFGPGQSPELEWLKGMEQAKAAFEASMVARIGAAAATDWRAAAFLLERRAPQRWHPKNKLELQVDSKKTVSIEMLSTDKLLEIAKGILPDHTQIKVLSADVGAVDEGAGARDAIYADLEPEPEK